MAILNFPLNPVQGDQYTGDNGTTYIFDGVKWIGRPAGGAAGTNSIQNGNFTVQVDADGNLIIPVGAVIKDSGGTVYGGSGSSDRLVNGNNSVVLGSTGTLTTSSFFPKSFTATCDLDHWVGEAGVNPFTSSDWWHFDITFAPLADGSVETQITNNTPWSSNPGYITGFEFLFTEVDHGIPGYTFTLTLTDVQNPGMFMYTTNLGATTAPTYPSTITSTKAVKLTSNDNSWIFGTDGSLTVPGSSPYATTGGMTIKNESFNGTTYLDGNGNDITLRVNATKTIYIEVGDAIWSFGDAGIGPDPILRLPVGGDIVDSNGVSVLGGGASTGNIRFTSSNITSTTGYFRLTGGEDATIEIPQAGSGNPVRLYSNNSNSWEFAADGSLRTPHNTIYTDQNSGTALVPNTATLVFTSANAPWVGGIKLLLIAQGALTGQSLNDNGDQWHTQMADAIVANRPWGNTSEPVMTVYGVTYTSTNPFVTYTVRKNANTGAIEVYATTTESTYTIRVRANATHVNAF